MSRLQLLIPLDGTEFSRRILPEVGRLFTPDAWTVHLLHVANLPVATAHAYEPAAVGPDFRLYAYGLDHPTAGAHPIYGESELEEFRRGLEAALEAEVGSFRREGYEVRATVHFGSPVDEIVGFADENAVDLIAMATHHRTGLSRLFQGSVARSVLDRVRRPLLLLQLPEVEPADAHEAPAAVPERRDPAAQAPTGPGNGERERADLRQVVREVPARAAPPPPAPVGAAAHAPGGGMAAGGQLRASARGEDPTGDEPPRRPARGSDQAGGSMDDDRLRSSTQGLPPTEGPHPAGSGLRHRDRGDDQFVTPPPNESATLHGVRGTGVLTVLRAEGGAVVEVTGTWLPPAGGLADEQLERLRAAERDKVTVDYEGLITDAETADTTVETAERGERRVRITGVRTYTDEAGEPRVVVSFTPVHLNDPAHEPQHQYTQEEFERLSLAEVAELTGMAPPEGGSAPAEAEYREKAWRSYQLDIEHRDEWGTARQGTELPHGE